MDTPEAAAARQGHSFMPCFLPEWEQHCRPSPCPVPSRLVAALGSLEQGKQPSTRAAWWCHSREALPPLLAVARSLCHQLCTDQHPVPWQLCSGAAEPSALLFWLSPGSAEPAPQVSASPVLSGSVQSMRQMLGTRAGAVLAVMSSGGFCHLTRATFLAKTNVLSHTSQLPLQHGLLLPGLREGRGWRSDAKVLKYLCM